MVFVNKCEFSSPTSNTMANLKNKSLRYLSRTFLLTAVLSFAGMFAFSPVLHAHDLDLGHPQKECAPCHWSQTHIGDSTGTVDVADGFLFQHLHVEYSTVRQVVVCGSFSIRAPPQVL